MVNRSHMDEKESYDTAREARQAIFVHPEQASRHEEALTRYLGGVAYRVTREHEVQEGTPPPVHHKDDGEQKSRR